MQSGGMRRARGIDHLVLAVADLHAARERYAGMGFTLTPVARHPFGTANSLVQLDGVFLELLAMNDPHSVPPHEPDRFSFAAFNRDYLATGEGCSMLVLDSSDARADREAFLAAGLRCYEPFDFARKARLPTGEEATVGFSLAFTTHPEVASAGFFVCQQHAPQHFWKQEYQRHENTATKLLEVCLVTHRPLHFADFLQAFSGSDDVVVADGRLEVGTARGTIVALTVEHFAERYGVAPPRAHRLPALCGFTIGVEDPQKAKSAVERAGMTWVEGNGRFTVAPADAFGTALAVAKA
jgi:hypothetical protein